MNTLEEFQQSFGPLMASRDVQQVLRFRTPEGLRAARSHGRLNLEMFRVKGRRGVFARTPDVVRLVEGLVGIQGNAGHVDQVAKARRGCIVMGMNTEPKPTPPTLSAHSAAGAPADLTEFEAELQKWNDNPEDVYLENEVHAHFERANYTSYPPASRDGLHMFNRVMDWKGAEEAQESSAIGAVIGGVAAAGFGAALRALSLALNVNEHSIAEVLEDYTEGGETLPMGMEEFARRLTEADDKRKHRVL